MRKFGDLIISKNDRCLYRPIQLKNSIDCLLISDKNTDKSATALSVNIGSICQPKSTPGLAHFLQHMLFMGTQKYPSQNQYSQYLAKNSGSSNAYTGHQQTNFHFEVSNKAFFGALDRFAQFFIKPLLSKGSIEKEMNAVDSQHTKNLNTDIWRFHQLTKFAAKTNSKLNAFSTGNLKTLNTPTIYEDLLRFYNQNYSANLMKLVVYGQNDLDTLQKNVIEMFSDVPNHNKQRQKINQVAYDQENLGKLYKIVPVKSTNKLEIKFFFEDFSHKYQNCPLKYLSFLIGHQGQNSLLSALIAEGLALQLGAGPDFEKDFFSEFLITIVLTQKGLAQYQRTIEIIGKYIGMLKQKGTAQRIFKEIQTLNRLKFDNKDGKKGLSACTVLSSNLHLVPMQHVQVKNYLMQKFQPKVIQEVIKGLSLKKSLIFLISKQFQKYTDQVQQIYGTHYKKQNISSQLIQRFDKPKLITKSNLDLPPQNTFFPKTTQLNINQKPIPFPIVIQKSSHFNLYHKQDNTFKLPKAAMVFDINYRYDNTARNECIRRICQKMIKNYFREFMYMAQQAYLIAKIDLRVSALQIQVAGFSDSMPRFIAELLKKLKQFSPALEQQNFANLLAQTKNQIQNLQKNQPYQQNYSLLQRIIKINSDNAPQQLLSLIDVFYFNQGISLNDTIHWYGQLLTRIFGDILILGDVPQKTGKEVLKQFENNFAQNKLLQRSDYLQIRPINIPSKIRWCVEKELSLTSQQNSSIIVHFQYQQFNPITQMHIQLLQLFIKEPAFDYLRTKKQLGYIVFTIWEDYRGVLGINLLVQSNIVSSMGIVKYIDELLSTINQKLDSMEDKQFQEFVNALQVKIGQKDKKLSQQKDRYLKQIKKHLYVFDRQQQNLQAIKEITKQSFKQTSKQILFENEKRIQVHIISSKLKDEYQRIKKQRVQKGQIKITNDPYWLQRRFSLYPDMYSML